MASDIEKCARVADKAASSYEKRAVKLAAMDLEHFDEAEIEADYARRCAEAARIIAQSIRALKAEPRPVPQPESADG